jgi:predicted transposase YdaD
MKESGAAEALLRERLPRALALRLDGKPVAMPESFVEESLRGSVTDLLLRVRLKGRRPVYVYCLVEHKRTDEPAVMLQLLRYLSALYDELARKHGHRNLPLVVPLVVYNGGRPWRGPRRFSDLLERRAGRLGLDFGMVLVDLCALPVDALSQHRTLRGGLLGLKVASSPPEVQGDIVQQAAATLAAEPSTQRLFLRYLLRIVDQKTLPVVKQVLREALKGKETKCPPSLSICRRRATSAASVRASGSVVKKVAKKVVKRVSRKVAKKAVR